MFMFVQYYTWACK